MWTVLQAWQGLASSPGWTETGIYRWLLLNLGPLSSCFTMSTIFFSISLTVGTSRLMEAQMDLPRLLFGVGFQIFFYNDASNVYVLSWIYLERARLIDTTASDAYKRCKSRLRTVWHTYSYKLCKKNIQITYVKYIVACVKNTFKC